MAPRMTAAGGVDGVDDDSAVLDDQIYVELIVASDDDDAVGRSDGAAR